MILDQTGICTGEGKTLKFDFSLLLCIRINTSCVEDLYLTGKTTSHPDSNKAGHLHDPGMGGKCLKSNLMRLTIREQTDKLDFIKIRKFYNFEKTLSFD